MTVLGYVAFGWRREAMQVIDSQVHTSRMHIDKQMEERYPGFADL